ncbi:extracellular solute-binding protein [Streptacidiphilus rugosus]|uniref:extracellular solute-binding protein n=1 Tax=Streptacidiphilus rugosus TaxID=405783 RepID=UPI00055B6FE9|nr:extracellular solute-binding protein [Streptacidiphilus rugosus]
MRHRQAVLGICSAAVALSLSGCGLSGLGQAKSSPSPTSWQGKTLVVWLMKGDDSAAWMDSVKSAFLQQYAGAKIDFQVQDWTGIQQKVTDALASLTPPDVIDIGNTQTPYYAASGGLMDLTPYLGGLGASTWNSFMNKSTIYQKKQYAAPWYAGNRVVMYNKKLWKRAGLGPTPTTQEQWLSDLATLQQTSGVSSAMWLPGQNWYAFDGFLQDEGAQLVREDSPGVWSGNLDSPQALRATAFFKKLRSFGKAPVDVNEANQAAEFAKGNVGCMIAMGYEAATAVSKNVSADDIGWFPIPGKTANRPARTFLGGSNLTVSLNTQNKDLALGFLKIALNDVNESLMAKTSGFLPNRTSLYGALAGNTYAQAAAKSAPDAGYTPLLPTWGNVETSPNPVITLYLGPILQGHDASAAAQAADTEMTTRLAWN